MKTLVMVTMVIAVTLGQSAQTQTPVSARVIEHDLTVRSPLVPCSAPSAVGFIARAVDAPAGVEYVPESCAWDQPRAATEPITETVHLGGMTVAEAMDRIVTLDTRYHWGINKGGFRRASIAPGPPNIERDMSCRNSMR